MTIFGSIFFRIRIHILILDFFLYLIAAREPQKILLKKAINSIQKKDLLNTNGLLYAVDPWYLLYGLDMLIDETQWLFAISTSESIMGE